ncbi:MAG: hypothetical protein H0U75_08340 [Legionella sp.]|nr:hypothetical protein [Legionella sp.]
MKFTSEMKTVFDRLFNQIPEIDDSNEKQQDGWVEFKFRESIDPNVFKEHFEGLRATDSSLVGNRLIISKAGVSRFNNHIKIHFALLEREIYYKKYALVLNQLFNQQITEISYAANSAISIILSEEIDTKAFEETFGLTEADIDISGNEIILYPDAVEHFNKTIDSLFSKFAAVQKPQPQSTSIVELESKHENFPIQLDKPLEECQSAFAEKLSRMNVQGLLPLRFDSLEFKAMLNRSPNPIVWWQMATDSLGILMGWYKNLLKRTQNVFTPIRKRDVFMAYLKSSILRQHEGMLLREGMPVNLNASAIHFLLGLSSRMTKNNLTVVPYTYPNSQETPAKGMEWTTHFFGNPFVKEDKVKLRQLNAIREVVKGILYYQDGHWNFLDKSFIGILSSMNVLELSLISSRLRVQGFSYSDASSRAINNFSLQLFSHPEGPLYYAYRSSGWDPDAAFSFFTASCERLGDKSVAYHAFFKDPMFDKKLLKNILEFSGLLPQMSSEESDVSMHFVP